VAVQRRPVSRARARDFADAPRNCGREIKRQWRIRKTVLSNVRAACLVDALAAASPQAHWSVKPRFCE
jgi:hypothetical protein